MRTGTKSVLFGAHCFLLHPWFVAAGWWKLYGFPFDPRLWVAFFVHDLGYMGKVNMDDEEGERHVFLGAKIMHWLFDEVCGTCPFRQKIWYQFSFYHSRFMAKRYNASLSKLAYADKLAIVLTPSWLYLPMANWSGEIWEYMKLAKASSERDGKYVSMNIYSDDQRVWFENVKTYLRAWLKQHQYGSEDTWTPSQRPQ